MLYFSRRSRNHRSGVDWCSSSTYSHAGAPSALRRIAYSRSDSLSRRRPSMKLTDCHRRLDQTNASLIACGMQACSTLAASCSLPSPNTDRNR